jgi:aminoglycoside phosphotransferase (APT) family kinase protein
VPIDAADPVLAVVAPPRLARFRERAGLGPDEPIAADFSGWSKLVLLTADRAFLFPRDHTQAEFLEREIEALRALAPLGMREVPELQDVWDDPDVSAHRVVVVGRFPGTMLDREVATLDTDAFGHVLEQVAVLAARWHEADPGPLADRPPREQSAHRHVDALLGQGPDAPEPCAVAAEAAGRLGLSPAERRAVEGAVDAARRLPPTVVHGDLHEGQILVDSDRQITGIIDWQTARVGHPFTEFDLGEWDTGTWRTHRRSFPELRRRQWAAYAAARGLDDSLAEVFEIVWALVHALRWPESVYVGSEVTGTFEGAVDDLRAALR